MSLECQVAGDITRVTRPVPIFGARHAAQHKGCCAWRKIYPAREHAFDRKRALDE